MDNKSENTNYIDHRAFKRRDPNLHSHYEFCATLEIRTPLKILKRHGERFYGPYEEIPKICEPTYGIWYPKTKTYRELGEDMDELKIEHASDIGYTVPDEYLPFLIKFRKIYEPNISNFEKFKQIKTLCKKNTRYQKICKKLDNYHEHFPESFILGTLYQIDGVGYKTVQELNKVGITKLSELKYADKGMLSKIPGIGKNTLKNIKNYFDNNMSEF